jgi:potassium-transporting ATPase KdpC subunit
MSKLMKPAIGLFSLLTVLTGIIYPLAVTGIAQWLFPEQATGSLILEDE